MYIWLSLSLAIVAFGTGIVAAVYWFRASIVEIPTDWGIHSSKPLKAGARIPTVDELNAYVSWIFAIKDAFEKSSRLNKSAATWTAIAVLLGTLATVSGILPAFH